ncbi:MAG TPA: Hpt domain-containing protein [Candidatus Hydrogenedentes bacterium]|nr:Hpt domain-containing protein [Candidatus Hydrogenedentota bacterium]
MSHEDAIRTVEAVAEALVFADPKDLPALADIHSRLETLRTEAEGAGLPVTAQKLKEAADTIEKIVLSEAPDPVASLEQVGKVISSAQRVFRDGLTENEVFGEATRPDESTPEDKPTGTWHYERPPYVDDAILTEFLTRQDTELQELEADILAIEQKGTPEFMADLKRRFHTLKGESGLLGFPDIEKLCHAAEDLLADGAKPPVDLLLEVKDWIRRALDAVMGRGTYPESPSGLLSKLKGNAQAESTDSKQANVPEVETTSTEPKPLTGDHDLLRDFIVEAGEHLEAADLHLLELENDASNADAINAVFRAFHTIKGVAGFLALEDIQRLAHQAENLLDQVRKGAVEMKGPVVDAAFESVDMLKNMVAMVQAALTGGGGLVTPPGMPALLKRLKAAAEGKVIPREQDDLSAAGDAPLLGDLLVSQGIADPASVERALAKQREAAPPKLGEVLKREALASSRDIETALSLQENEAQGKKIGEVLVEMGRVAPEDVERAARKQQELSQQPPKLGEILVASGEVRAKDVAQALRTQQQALKGGGETVQVREAVKVDADRLDHLLDMIGELVIAESMVFQSEDLRGVASGALTRHLTQLDKITRELQEMAMSLRMVPIRTTFQKMARLVRDLSKKTGKPVEFSMSGEDTELDKTVVDKIGDPLVHMVRNAVDHGLEDSVEERLAKGKPAAGTVHLSAFHEGGNIHIQVRDDGRGLNKDAILRKAIERGLIREGEPMSERDIFNLIFQPGFSTAKQVTEVSGRGVGMDVVKRNIESLRGQVLIESTPGQGSVFTIILPLTLAIIDGMVVRVGSQRYILPTLSIVQSIRPEAKDLNTVVGSGETLKVHGDLLPLFSLKRVFGLNEGVDRYVDGTVVVVEKDGKRAGLLVDEILGQQQIVIKSLGEGLQGIPGIAGGAIMPDGLVGLILDVGGIMRLATGV